MKLLTVILATVTLMGCTTHIPIRTETIINASPATIFAILIDFENYASWNPYHIKVSGEPVVGSSLDVTVRRPDGKIIEVPAVHILRLNENAELTWGGGINGIFYGEHVLKLEPLADNKTRLIHNEDFEGIFIGFADLPSDILTRGYVLMNEALKAVAEKQGASASLAVSD